LYTESQITELLEQYPFLTYLVYGGVEYIGIIQNSDDQITTIYDFSKLKSKEEKMTFLDLADVWWWESNRLIPINVFLKQDWYQFQPCRSTFNSKDVDIRFGPSTSLKQLSVRRSKRRSITLVRKTD
jgi:hypothetical protein